MLLSKMSLQAKLRLLVGFGNSHVVREIASRATTSVTAFHSAPTTVTSHQKIAQVRKIEQNNHFPMNSAQNSRVFWNHHEIWQLKLPISCSNVAIPAFLQFAEAPDEIESFVVKLFRVELG